MTGDHAVDREDWRSDPSGSSSAEYEVSVEQVSKLRILLANDPRSYRDLLAATFQILKSEAEVIISEPQDLDFEMQSFAPHLVVCSRLTPAIENTASSWIELYPNFKRLAHICIGGERSTVEGIELTDLLRAVDEVEQMVEFG